MNSNASTNNDPRRFRDLPDAERLAVQATLAKRGIDLNANRKTIGDHLSFRAEVRRAINDETNALQTMLGKNHAADWNAELQAKFDKGEQLISGLGALVDHIDADIRLAEFTLDANRKLAGGAGEGWRGRDGNHIQVLGPQDSFRAAVGGERSHFGFGDYIRAMVVGTDHHDIRAALTEGTDSTGGFTVPRYLLGEIIDAMRARTVCVQAGARTVPLDGYQNTIVRVAADPAAGWRLENGAIAEGNPTFEGLVLQPKSLAVLVKISRELIEDSLNITEALTAAFAGSMAAEVDRVSLIGSGTDPEPRGIFSTVGINEVSMGTNGAALTSYAKILDALYEVELDNGPSPSAMVMHPRTRRTINGFADTTNQPLQVPPALADMRNFATTNIPVNQTQGTATNASCIIMGDYAQLLLGVRNELRIELLRERYAENHQYAFIAHLRMDVGVAQPAAFCAVKGIIP